MRVLTASATQASAACMLMAMSAPFFEHEADITHAAPAKQALVRAMIVATKRADPGVLSKGDQEEGSPLV